MNFMKENSPSLFSFISSTYPIPPLPFSSFSIPPFPTLSLFPSFPFPPLYFLLSFSLPSSSLPSFFPFPLAPPPLPFPLFLSISFLSLPCPSRPFIPFPHSISFPFPAFLSPLFLSLLPFLISLPFRFPLLTSQLPSLTFPTLSFTSPFLELAKIHFKS